jgi:copper chaperone CopZ
MHRRDISKALFATAAGSTVIAQRVEAQTCATPCYAQTAAEIAAGVTPVNYAYPECTVERYGTNTTPGTTPMTTAIQNCINVCSQYPQWKTMTIMTQCRVTATLYINRLVNGSTTQYFRITSTTGGGFFVTTPITIFSSTVATYTTAPITQLVLWDGVFFSASSASVGAFVLDQGMFLRVQFNRCDFTYIQLLATSQYIQSIYLFDCNIRFWSGYFCYVANANFDVRFEGNLIEDGGGGFGYHASTVQVAYINNLMEGIAGTAITYGSANGLTIIGNYFEGNTRDVDGQSLGGTSTGISMLSNWFDTAGMTDGNYGVLWGTCTGCVAMGNVAVNNLHGLASASASLLEINDVSQTGNVSNLDAIANKGYRAGTPSLTIRGGTSASYSVSALTANYESIGYAYIVNFVCTLTSTGTNSADNLYISSGLPGGGVPAPNMLCGHCEVVGSSQNSGISPLYVSNPSPVRALSSITVLPANTAGNSWTVRGYLVYPSS